MSYPQKSRILPEPSSCRPALTRKWSNESPERTCPWWASSMTRRLTTNYGLKNLVSPAIVAWGGQYIRQTNANAMTPTACTKPLLKKSEPFRLPLRSSGILAPCVTIVNRITFAEFSKPKDILGGALTIMLTNANVDAFANYHGFS